MSASAKKIPLRKLFVLRCTAGGMTLPIEAHTYVVEGTPAGWVLEFTTVTGAETDGNGDYYTTSRKTLTLPAQSIWSIDEEESAAGVVH